MIKINTFMGNINKSLLALLVAATTLAPMIYSDTAFALTDQERIDRQAAKTKIPNPRIGKKVGQAFELYSAEQVTEALTLLTEMDPGSGYDGAFLNKFIGNLYATVEGKSQEALKYLNMAYEVDELNYKEQGEVIKLIAQLNLMEKQYDKAIKMYEEWMSFTGEQDPKIYVRIANAYYEMKQLDKVIAPADKAIGLTAVPDQTPYVLKLASYFERKQYKETVKVAETLVQIFPEEKRNWVQLGNFYVVVEDYKKALSVMELAYKQGFFEKENQFRSLAQMYSQNELPIKAAHIQEKYLKLGVITKTEQNLKSLANYFLAAKEMDKAASYFGEAAELVDSAYLYKRQGEMLFQAEKYGVAAIALNKALNKNVEKQGSVTMTLMQCYFYQGKYKAAFDTLMAADKFPEVRGQVKSWKQYIIDKADRHGVKLK